MKAGAAAKTGVETKAGASAKAPAWLCWPQLVLFSLVDAFLGWTLPEMVRSLSATEEAVPRLAGALALLISAALVRLRILRRLDPSEGPGLAGPLYGLLVAAAGALAMLAWAAGWSRLAACLGQYALYAAAGAALGALTGFWLAWLAGRRP